jgi:hypothetical protein
LPEISHYECLLLIQKPTTPACYSTRPQKAKASLDDPARAQGEHVLDCSWNALSGVSGRRQYGVYNATIAIAAILLIDNLIAGRWGDSNHKLENNHQNTSDRGQFLEHTRLIQDRRHYRHRHPGVAGQAQEWQVYFPGFLHAQRQGQAGN